MQQLRLFFAMALLYMFRVTIPPIIRSTMLYMASQVGMYTYVVIFFFQKKKYNISIPAYLRGHIQHCTPDDGWNCHPKHVE